MDNKYTINIKIAALKESKLKSIIFGVSGSVATIKAKDIASSFLSQGFNVILISTSHS
jgi:phosphopantothenoylcysteine synthetase/decarboxylase